MTKKESLSLEAQTSIRQYLLKLVALPGAAAVVVAAFLGYLVNDLARGSAYQDSYREAFSSVVDVISTTASDATTAALQAELAREEALQVQTELDQITQTVKASELLTSTERQIAEIADALMDRSDFIERVNLMQEFKDLDRQADPVSVQVPGGTEWGRWYEPAFCRRTHYVCGLRQRVEPPQGRGDDTSVNDIELLCCPLFSE